MEKKALILKTRKFPRGKSGNASEMFRSGLSIFMKSADFLLFKGRAQNTPKHKSDERDGRRIARTLPYKCSHISRAFRAGHDCRNATRTMRSPRAHCGKHLRCTHPRSSIVAARIESTGASHPVPVRLGKLTLGTCAGRLEVHNDAKSNPRRLELHAHHTSTSFCRCPTES